MSQFCSRINNLYVTIFASTLLLFFALIVQQNDINGGGLLPLPSSSWWSSWTAQPSCPAVSPLVALSTQSPPSPPNPKTAFYPTFNNVKMQKASAVAKMQNAVAKMVEELKVESELRRGKEKDKKLERIEAELSRARALIKDAIVNGNNGSHVVQDEDDDNFVLRGDIYRNAYAFQRSYSLMESMFKIYVYEEGEPPLFHSGPCKDIYSLEGVFLNQIELENTRFRTHNPDEAHAFFLPFSVVMILEELFDPVVRDKAVLERVVGDYVRIVSTKYAFWNRSLAADHFMLSCHDWGPRSTWYVHGLYFSAIRALCNANTSEFFNPKKDVPIPEINLKNGGSIGPIGGLPYSERTILAFFAGALHGRIRPALFRHWRGKDEDIKVYEKVPEGTSYEDMVRKSKFCLCPSGFEVASPRIVEAIYAECVPVLISQHYVLPFSDVLDWDKFSISVSVEELPELKKILLGVSEDRYVAMRENVRQARRHFVVNDVPKRYDVFHMIVHSVWLRRLNVRICG
ncbi:probable glycosyltransferase At3g07620 isoform X1 [Ipomoea triloba]|uniref:probable glycosyltransferase At3g07620 isoform X1 n=2 Tax=Ipomoea triloba TaxID=35885 RepID=UPI00125E639B|nr:probable glycosyltransferase At3g07620 isoform X1 [Ipomoea triloba]